MNKKALKKIDLLSQMVVTYVNESLVGSRGRTQPIQKLFEEAISGVNFKSEDSISDLAMKGNRKYRASLVEIIFNYLGEINFREQDLDEMLSGYYINYYGKCDDLTSSHDIRVFTDQINKILIPRNSPKEVKMKKLAQVCFQEIYGVGPLDEFLNLMPDQKFNKIEEIAMAGHNQLSLKISGINVKLDKLKYDKERCKRVAKRLAKCSSKSLTENNYKVETELLDKSRINLTCPPFSEGYTINIRRHYDMSSLTVEKKVELGSTTWEFERFLDIISDFKVSVLIVGAQGVGKSTSVREFCCRFPRNTVVVTAESSFELSLEKVKHLSVIPLRTGVMSPDDLITSLFRFNANALVLGEARSPEDVMIYTQTSQRQDYGTISTWHTYDAITAIRSMSKAYLRGGYATTEDESITEICNSVDLVIVNSICDEKHGDYCGLRHIFEVCEVPKGKKITSDTLELNTLFKFDYKDMKLKKVNTLTEGTQEFLLNRTYLPKRMEVLRSGKYN